MFFEYSKAILSTARIINALSIKKHAIASSLLLPRLHDGHNRAKATKVDILDSFVVALCEKRASKWENQSKNNTVIELTPNRAPTTQDSAKLPYQTFFGKINSLCGLENSCDIRTMETSSLEKLLLNALDSDDEGTFRTLVDQCLQYNILPSTVAVLRILRILCIRDYDGSMAVTTGLIEMSETTNPRLYQEHCELHPFKAQCLWNAQKYTEALDFLKSFYGHPRTEVRRSVAENYRKIVDDLISNKGVAVLVNMISHADDILVSFNDPSVLEFIWVKCFVSDGFSDQQLAGNLFAKYVRLREITSPKTSALVFSLLQLHKLDTVYRLIEQVGFSYINIM